MKRNILIVGLVAIGLMTVGSIPTAAEDRQANFLVGVGVDHGLNGVCAEHVEDPCPVTIVSGIMSTTCDDDQDGWFDHNDDGITGERPFGEQPAFHGVGGVNFCEIAKGEDIEVQIDDPVLTVNAKGAVTCVISETDAAGVTWHRSFGEASPTMVGQVPDWCTNRDPTRSDTNPDNTDVGTFIRTGNGITGSVHLCFPACPVS